MQKFESEIGKMGRRHWFFSEDDYKLARMHMRNFAESIVKDLSRSSAPLNILNVEPSENVYKECCNEFFETKNFGWGEKINCKAYWIRDYESNFSKRLQDIRT